MHKLLVAFSVTTVFALHSAANAATISILSAGQLSNGGSIASFNGLTQTPYGQTTAAGPFSNGGASFSGTGLIMRNPGLNPLGLYAQPLHDTTNYLAVLGGGSETITYSGQRQSFGLYWGSIDAYNTITFYNNGVATVAVSGSDLVPLIPNGNQTSDDSNRYVTFSNLIFDKVVLSSGQNSFEVDNIAAGVPELATWMMMMFGFAGVGLFAHRRARTVLLASRLA